MSPRRGRGETRAVTLNKRNRLTATLSYLARRPGTSPSISIRSKTPRREVSESISLTNMNSVKAIQSAARSASQSHSSGSDKLETIPQTGPIDIQDCRSQQGRQTQNQPALPCSLQRRRIGLFPQRPVWSAAYS